MDTSIAGKRTRESLGGQVDPLGSDKDDLEDTMAVALTAYFAELLERVKAELEPRIPADRKAINIPMSFWREEASRLLSILLNFVNTGANGGVRRAQAVVEEIGIGLDWTMPFTQAADWARRHCAELVSFDPDTPMSIINTTRERIRASVANWIETPDMGLPDLWKQLQEDHAFSRYRAELIAQTETTRAYAEGEMAGAKAMEEQGYIKYQKEWKTVALFGSGPGTVCPICEPLHNTTVDGTDGEFDTAVGMLLGPPAHPGCRCWINVIPSIPE